MDSLASRKSWRSSAFSAAWSDGVLCGALWLPIAAMCARELNFRLLLRGLRADSMFAYRSKRSWISVPLMRMLYPMGHCGSTGFVRSVSLASVIKMFVMASAPKRSNSDGTSRCAKRYMSSFKSCSLAYLQKKVASVTCGRSGSILVGRNALTRRAVAESHDSSGFVVIESRTSRAACFASEFNPSSRTSRRSQSVAVTCRTCVGSHCPEIRYTTTGWDSVIKQ